jgi:GST-like protein
MLTLHGARCSGSAAVECALRHGRLPYRLVEGATWEPSPGYEALKTLNPMAQVPTLVLEDGSALTESAAILIHLGLTHPKSGLLPADATQRAHAIQGLVFIAANLYSLISIIDYPARYTTATTKPAHERVRAGARARLHVHWERFADMFPATPWLSGHAPGALDYLACLVSRWSGARAHLAQSRPATAELLARIQELPHAKPVFAQHWPA